MASDMDRIIDQLAELTRKQANMIRHGTVHEVKKGRYRIKWGDEYDGKEQTEGAEKKPWLSPWIRMSQHSGLVSENKPMVKGQSVTSVSMDADHRMGLVMPHSDSENNPMDGDASDDAHTYRIRKPPAEGEGGGGGSGGATEPTKRQDDEDDFRIKRSYDGFEVHAGKDVSFFVTRSGVVMKFAGQEVKLDADGFKMKTKGFTGEQSE